MQIEKCLKSYSHCFEPLCTDHVLERWLVIERIAKNSLSNPRIGIKNALKYVLARDGNVCQLCHYPCFSFPGDMNSRVAPSVDHIVEARLGGSLRIDNIRLAHRFCNSSRAMYPDPRKHPKFKQRVLDTMARVLKDNMQ